MLPTLLLAAQLFALPSPSGNGSAQPFLSASRDALLLSWMEPVAESKRVALRFARFHRGQWSEPRTIAERDDFFVNWADFPSLIEDDRGVLYAHWLQKSGPGTYSYDVRMSISSDGGRTWGSSFVVHRDGTKTEHGFASLAPRPGGGVAAVWLDGRNMPEGKEEGEMSVRFATIDARGAIRAEHVLDSRACECCTTAMAMASGGPVVFYRDRSAEEIRDIAVVRQKGSSWTSPRLLHADGWKINGCPVNGPQADAIGNRVVAAWFTAADDKGRVRVAFSSDGGATFDAPLIVDDGKPTGRVDVILLDASTALVTWIEQTPAGAEVRARRVPRAGKATPSIKVGDSSSARAAGFPRMARVGREVYFAWTQQASATDKRVRVMRTRF